MISLRSIKLALLFCIPGKLHFEFHNPPATAEPEDEDPSVIPSTQATDQKVADKGVPVVAGEEKKPDTLKDKVEQAKEIKAELKENALVRSRAAVF